MKVGDIGLRKVRSRKRPQRKNISFDVDAAATKQPDEKIETKSTKEQVQNNGDNTTTGGDGDGDVDYNSKNFIDRNFRGFYIRELRKLGTSRVFNLVNYSSFFSMLASF